MTGTTRYKIGFVSDGVKCKLGALRFYSASVQVDSLVLRNAARTPCSKTLFPTPNKDYITCSIFT
jgi:hypothetical protein